MDQLLTFFILWRRFDTVRLAIASISESIFIKKKIFLIFFSKCFFVSKNIFFQIFFSTILF